MTNEINELDSIRKTITEVGFGVERVGADLRKTQAQMIALRAVLATVLVQALNMTPESALQLLGQADTIACSNLPDTEAELSKIRRLLESLQTKISGQA